MVLHNWSVVEQGNLLLYDVSAAQLNIIPCKHICVFIQLTPHLNWLLLIQLEAVNI